MMQIIRNLRTIFIFLGVCLSQTLMQSSIAATSMQIIPGESQTSLSKYAHVTLSNELAVILVSDPKAERFAAALAVNAGNFQDPDEHPGIAHLLEHMLFLGTKKYPEANSYQAYIRQHGGSHNAFTSSQETNYYFDVLPDAYPEALDRFAQFFIAPTLDPNYIAREINAVDSEYRAKLNDETRRSNEAFKTLINQNHPSSRFTVGNLDTLGNMPTDTLKARLQGFYDNFYTPDNMTLVLVANKPLKTLETYARTYFSDIPLRKHTQKAELPVLVQAPHKIQVFQTDTEKSLLSLSFPIPSQIQNYATQPTRYISYVLGDESKNSLFSDLKTKNWAQSLHTGITKDDGNNALFKLTIRLTDEGVTHRNEVVARVFKAIDNLKQTDINPAYIKETRTLSQLNFAYHDYVPPMHLAQLLASRSRVVSPNQLLKSFRITADAKEKDIELLLKQLSKKRVLVQWQHPSISPDEWAAAPLKWQVEPLYQGKYANANLSEKWDNEVAQDLPNNYGQPKENPYIPDNLAITNHSDTSPIHIVNTPKLDFWHKTNSQFKKPTGMIFGYLGCTQNDSARDKLLLQLWAILFTDAMSESSYQPYNAGLNFSLYAHKNGLTLRTSGYTDKQMVFFKDLLNELLAFRAEPERLTVAKQEILKNLNNLDNQPPHALARHYFSKATTLGNSTRDAIQNHLISVTADEINQFIQKHIQRFRYIGYVTGNFERQESEKLANTLQNTLSNRLSEHQYQTVKVKSLAPNGHYVYQFNTRSSDSVVLYSLISTDGNNADHVERSYFRILVQLLSPRFYNEFRTEKQYGYIVGVTNQTIDQTPAIGFLVQSPNTDSDTLISEIGRFLEENSEWGNRLSDQEFEQARSAVLSQFSLTPKTLRESALEEWPHIVEPEHNFNDRETWIKTLKALSKDDFIVFIENKIEHNQAARVVTTNQWQDTTNWQQLSIQ